MAEQRRAFEVVDEETAYLHSPPPQPSRSESVGLSALVLGLKTLGQRTLQALADLFTLATVGSAFVLWMWTPDPNAHQLVGLGMYAVFVLAANWIVRRK